MAKGGWRDGGGVWVLSWTRGYVRMEYRYLGEPREHPKAGSVGGPGDNRGEEGMTFRSAANLRRQLVSLDWKELGDRRILMTLTYPPEWGKWVPDGRVFEGHRRAYFERWRRQWGPLKGVWVKEFQERGAPHLHVFCGLPDAVSEAEYRYLQDRTRVRHTDKEVRVGPLDRGQPLCAWTLDNWRQVVGTGDYAAMDRTYRAAKARGEDIAWSTVSARLGATHYKWGVDIEAQFWSGAAYDGRDELRVAKYLAAEGGKKSQKRPPEGFTGVGRYYGFVGLKPDKPSERLVYGKLADELRQRLRLQYNVRLRQQYHGNVPDQIFRPNQGDGFTVLGLGPDELSQIFREAEDASMVHVHDN